MGDVIQIQRRGNFTMVQNEIILEVHRGRLSLKALGMMTVIFSRPDGWDFSVSGLAAFCGCGRDAVRNALVELETAGYLERSQLHNSGGRFGGNLYIIRDYSSAPTEEEVPPLPENPTAVEPLPGKPLPEKPSTENPLPENPTQSNIDLKKDIPPYNPPRKRHKRKVVELDPEVRKMLNAYVAHDPALTNAMVAFMDVRVSLKAVNSPLAIKTMLNRLDRLSGGDRDKKIRILEVSVTNSWKSVFPLRDTETPSSGSDEYGGSLKEW